MQVYFKGWYKDQTRSIRRTPRQAERNSPRVTEKGGAQRNMTTPAEMVWEPPAPLSTHDVAMHDGAVVTLRRHGNPNGPRLVLSHGNGLAIDLYYPFWSLLAHEFDLVVFDLRNHGWNATGGLAAHTIPTFVRDFERTIKAIERHYGRKPQVGVFHSLSALVALLSPGTCSRFEAIVLFDPPLCRPGPTYDLSEAAAVRNAALTRRRAKSFRSLQDLAEALPYLAAFQRVVPGFSDLMARTTLRKGAGQSRYRPRCPPEHEARIMESVNAFAVAVDPASVRCPVKVIGADPSLPYPIWPTFNFAELLDMDYEFVPGTTHFLQVEKPEECVARLRAFMGAIVGG